MDSFQVQIDDLKSIGTGTNKKDAKRHASEAMLQLLGLETPIEIPVKSPEPVRLIQNHTLSPVFSS